MGKQVVHDFDGVIRILTLPDGWQVQEPSGNRAIGGGQGSFVLAGSTSLGVGVWGYRLPSRTGWLALATHRRIFLNEIARSPTPRVHVDILLDRPCTGAVETYNLDQFDLIAESNMRPASSCDCSVLMRSELGRS